MRKKKKLITQEMRKISNTMLLLAGAELMGIHHRGDWDLTRHSQYSGYDLSYEDNGNKFTPWDIETSAGVDRSLAYSFLIDAYPKTVKEKF